MDTQSHRLSKGEVIRVRNVHNPDGLTGTVLLASDTNPQSVAVFFGEPHTGYRMKDGGIAITNMLPLLIDYEQETVADLFGSEWEIDVRDDSATWREPE